MITFDTVWGGIIQANPAVNSEFVAWGGLKVSLLKIAVLWSI